MSNPASVQLDPEPVPVMVSARSPPGSAFVAGNMHHVRGVREPILAPGAMELQRAEELPVRENRPIC